MTETISADMTIGDVISKHPQVVDTLLKYGLHCVGCHVNAFETLEQGAKVHGIPEKKFQEMIKEVNNVLRQPLPEVIELTNKAVEKIKELRKEEGHHGFHFRIEVVPSGCSGLSYNFYFDDEQTEEDSVVECNDLKVLIDKSSLEYIKGSTVDFVDSLQGGGIKIDNPNATGGCGCGKSFSA